MPARPAELEARLFAPAQIVGAAGSQPDPFAVL
jgi:hypothetical protein